MIKKDSRCIGCQVKVAVVTPKALGVRRLVDRRKVKRTGKVEIVAFGFCGIPETFDCCVDTHAFEFRIHIVQTDTIRSLNSDDILEYRGSDAPFSRAGILLRRSIEFTRPANGACADGRHVIAKEIFPETYEPCVVTGTVNFAAAVFLADHSDDFDTDVYVILRRLITYQALVASVV